MPGRAWAAALLLVGIGSAPVAAQPSAPILGKPIAVSGESVQAAVVPFPPTTSDNFSIPAGYTDAPAVQRPTRAAGLGVPVAADANSAADPVPSATADPRTRPTSSSSQKSPDPVNDFLWFRSNSKHDSGDSGTKSKSKWEFGENLQSVVGNHGEWFRSDHAFDGFISPVTNPFLFEDPRSLTEVRPIFMYQQIPHSQLDFRGGGISYFGLQGRLAITDRLSFVINKFGGIWIDPGSASPIASQAGFAEIWFGPKYTFIRSEQTGTLAAAGLQFQVPVGSANAFQNTGSLSLVPYVSAAQNLFRDFSYGSFNVMGTTGYSASTTSARSDYWYLSGHIDMDVLNCHHFYPLFEMNYFVVTTNGNSTPIGSEGRDLINFGSQAAGKGLLTGAFGARYKITENAQFGGAIEIPFAGPKDLFLYRFTLDFILRY